MVEPVHVGDLWILAGQSNMEGRGKLVDFEFPQKGVSCFDLSDKWVLAEEPLFWPNESVDPVHWGGPEEKRQEAIRSERRELDFGAGLGLPFGKEVFLHTGVPVGLMICARGGTAMDQWDPTLVGLEGNSCYGAMMRRVKKLGGMVKGCLWFQGESDATEEAAQMYAGKMKRWICALRQDLHNPHLPIIYAQISRQYRHTAYPVFDSLACFWNRIQEEQRSLEPELQPAAIVPTIDATLSDVGHLDAASQKSVGQRMAWRALELAYGMKLSEAGPRPSLFGWNKDRTELTISMMGINGFLTLVQRVYGFYAEVDGTKEALSAIIAPDRMSVILCFDRPIIGNCSIWHGRGTNPTVNVKDEKDIPLLVFGPVSV
jgi:sialate O-acetylesterase